MIILEMQITAISGINEGEKQSSVFIYVEMSEDAKALKATKAFSKASLFRQSELYATVDKGRIYQAIDSSNEFYDKQNDLKYKAATYCFKNNIEVPCVHEPYINANGDLKVGLRLHDTVIDLLPQSQR